MINNSPTYTQYRSEYVKMDKFFITGPKRLKGKIWVSGSKNAALPIIAATILSPGNHLIHGVPDLMDVKTMGRLLEYMGAEFSYEDSTVNIDAGCLNRFEAPYELVRTMRASVLVLGPLLAKHGRARVSLPGGCAIGARPINLHLSGLEKMGARITLHGGYVHASAKRLKGTDIYFDTPTVTGTENLMVAATLAEGITRLENAACEPEIRDLAGALTSMGALINGAGEGVIEIEGVQELNPMVHKVIADRIEAATFLVAAGITGGDVTIRNACSEDLEAVIIKLRETGISISEDENGMRATGPERPLACDLRTLPYPGFPTDMQAQFMALMSVAAGTSVIRETIFENRFMHVAELRRMGADITVEGSTATVKGVKNLKGAPVMATDLRASASIVLAALAAEGETVIDRIYHIDRGYERIEAKLRSVGADIKRSRG